MTSKFNYLFFLWRKTSLQKNLFFIFRDIVVVEEEDETADYEEDVKTKDLVSYCYDEDHYISRCSVIFQIIKFYHSLVF